MSFSLSLFLHCTDVGRFLTDEINTVFASLDRQADVIASGVAKPPPRNSLLGMYIGLSEHADVVSHDGEDSPFSREAVNAHKHFCSMVVALSSLTQRCESAFEALIRSQDVPVSRQVRHSRHGLEAHELLELLQALEQRDVGAYDCASGNESSGSRSIAGEEEEEEANGWESDGWTQHRTSDGAVYYHHTKTGASSWDRPVRRRVTSAGQGKKMRPRVHVSRRGSIDIQYGDAASSEEKDIVEATDVSFDAPLIKQPKVRRRRGTYFGSTTVRLCCL